MDVAERSRYDMSFKYFLEMAPEDAVINSSSLTKFRKLRLKDTDLLNLLINKTLSLALKKKLLSPNPLLLMPYIRYLDQTLIQHLKFSESVPSYFVKQFTL